MKKILVSTVIIVSFIMYAILHKQTNAISSLPANRQTNPGSSNTSGSSSNTIFGPPTSNDANNNTDTVPPAPPSSTTSSGQYKDGEYTGSSADAYYGNIQVKAIIQNGKLTDVQFLDYPHDQSESRAINEYAMPQLTQEAIQAQSANVDIVTRATDSSLAFRQSLADALSQAK